MTSPSRKTKKQKKDKKHKSKKDKNKKKHDSSKSRSPSSKKSWSRSRSPPQKIIPPKVNLPYHDLPSPKTYQDKLQNLYKRIKEEKAEQTDRQQRQEEESRKQKLDKIKEGIQDEIMVKKQKKLAKKQVKGSDSSSSSSSDSDSSSDESFAEEIRKENMQIQTQQAQQENQQKQFETQIGPQPLSFDHLAKKISYGDGMFRGEGEAMAQYVESNKRIPRRGEVGLNSDQIEEFESMGYVMSGSRHKRMTAVRIKKEAKVYSVQEKKALQIFNYEQKVRRESILVDKFKESLQKKLNGIQ